MDFIEKFKYILILIVVSILLLFWFGKKEQTDYRVWVGDKYETDFLELSRKFANDPVIFSINQNPLDKTFAQMNSQLQDYINYQKYSKLESAYLKKWHLEKLEQVFDENYQQVFREPIMVEYARLSVDPDLPSDLRSYLLNQVVRILFSDYVNLDKNIKLVAQFPPYDVIYGRTGSTNDFIFELAEISYFTHNNFEAGTWYLFFLIERYDVFAYQLPEPARQEMEKKILEVYNYLAPFAKDNFVETDELRFNTNLTELSLYALSSEYLSKKGLTIEVEDTLGQTDFVKFFEKEFNKNNKHKGVETGMAFYLYKYYIGLGDEQKANFYKERIKKRFQKKSYFDFYINFWPVNVPLKNDFNL